MSCTSSSKNAQINGKAGVKVNEVTNLLISFLQGQVTNELDVRNNLQKELRDDVKSTEKREGTSQLTYH